MPLDTLLNEITHSINNEVTRQIWRQLFDDLKREDVEEFFMQVAQRMVSPIRCGGLDYNENGEPFYK